MSYDNKLREWKRTRLQEERRGNRTLGAVALLVWALGLAALASVPQSCWDALDKTL